MKIIKKIIIALIKVLMVLNALFWIFVCAAVIHGIWTGDEYLTGYLAYLVILLIMVAFMTAPFGLYSLANRRFKFDIKEKRPEKVKSRNILKRKGYIHQDGALEIFCNKDILWLVLIMCLGILMAGCNFLPLGIVGKFFCFVIFITFGPLAILVYKNIMDETPVLVLTDDKVIFPKYRPPKELPYTEIAEVEIARIPSGRSRVWYLVIRAQDPSKLKKGLLLTVLDKMSGFGDALYIGTSGILEYRTEELVDIITKKKNSPHIPIQEFMPEKPYSPITPNRPQKRKQALYTVFSLLILASVLNDLSGDPLHMSWKSGYTDYYGLSAWLMITSAIIMSVLLLSVVIDRNGRKINEVFLGKFQSYSFRLGLAAFFIALAVNLFQMDRDYVCRNEILQKVASPDGGMNAFIIQRYCALHDPMKDKEPGIGVSVYDSKVRRIPDEPFNVVNIEGCTIRNMYWERSRLIIEYSVPDAKSRWHASPRKISPVPVSMRRVGP